MNVQEVLSSIRQISEENHLSEPFICGGIPRDKILDRKNDFGDIDLTTGDRAVHLLAKKTAELFPSAPYHIMPDGHARIFLNELKLDFSSNFNIPGITYLLKKNGIANPSSMQKEIYSRDFTCNALLMSTDLQTIQDPTGLGLKDIENKIIKTCLPVNLTLGYDNKRIIRVIYLSAKLNFDIDPEIKDWIKQHPELIANCRPQYLSKKLQKSLNYNKDKTIQLLDELGLWGHIPLLPDLIKPAQQLGRL